MSLGLWGPPGGDGSTKLRAQRGEHDAGIPEGCRLLKSQERWEQTLEGTQTPHPRTLPPSEARSGSGAARRAPPRRWRSAGPAPRRAAPAAPPPVLWCLALPPRRASGSRRRRAAASGAVTKCGQRRHSPRLDLQFGIPAGPGRRLRPRPSSEARAAASGRGPLPDLARPPPAPACPFGHRLTAAGPPPSLRPPVSLFTLGRSRPPGRAPPSPLSPRGGSRTLRPGPSLRAGLSAPPRVRPTQALMGRVRPRLPSTAAAPRGVSCRALRRPLDLGHPCRPSGPKSGRPPAPRGPLSSRRWPRASH